MKKIVLLDDNSNVINSYEWEKTYIVDVSPTSSVSSIEFEEFINCMDEDVETLIPVNNGEDFIIKYFDSFILDLFDLSSECVVNKLYSQVFPFFVSVGFVDILRYVYKTHNDVKCRLLYYENDELKVIVNKHVLFSENRVFVLIKRENSADLTYRNEPDMFFTSKVAMVVIQDGVFVRVNEAYSKLSGYSVDYLIGQKFAFNGTYLDGPENKNIYGVYLRLLNRESYAFDEVIRITHKKGYFAWFKSIWIPVSFENKPAVQVICVDITESKLLEEEALDLKNNLDKIQGLTKIAICHWDKDNLFHWTSEVYNLFEMDKDDFCCDVDFTYNLMVQEDKLIFKKNFLEVLSKNIENYTQKIRIKTMKGNLKYLDCFVNITYDDNGSFSLVSFIQDITDSMKYINDLNDTLERLDVALAEKEVLLKEVHHRVKNNLQIILSLLRLDERFNPENPEEILKSMVNRINSIALIHEKVYGVTDLSHVNLKEYIIDELNSIFNLYSIKNIKLNLDLEEVNLSIDKSIPVGLIINEIVNNTIKYAFPNDASGNLFVSLKNSNDLITIVLADDGVGIPEDINIYNSPSLGLTIINNLTTQIEGKFLKLPFDGTAFELSFEKG